MVRRTHVRQSYPASTKRDVVKRVLVDGQTQAQVAREMNIVEQTINNWVASALKVPEVWGLPRAPEPPVPASQVAQVATQHRNLGADIGFSDGVEAMRAAVLGTLYGFRATAGVNPEAEYDRLMMAVRRMDIQRTP